MKKNITQLVIAILLLTTSVSFNSHITSSIAICSVVATYFQKKINVSRTAKDWYREVFATPGDALIFVMPIN